jgi:putative ubiquitin-RnfH superfamily antitoxin RatB of RatAB toxin-antitoxin module
MIRVELIRAWPSRCETTTVELADDASVADALVACGWSLGQELIGLAVFGVAATQTTPLHDGDRVELLRGLRVDPKQARRLRAERSGKSPSP